MSIDIGTIYANLQIRNASQVQAELSKTTTVINGFQRSMQIAAGVLMRDLFYGFVDVIREATELGAQIQTLKNSFEAFTDAAGAQWLTLDRLRTATMGMVSDVDLLTQANRMLSAGMPVDQVEELFSGAIKLGKAMGIDASMAIEKLTLGLVRQSWRLMDDLGIIMRANQAYEEYAKTIGTTTDKLSAQQKQLAWIIFGTEQVTSRVKILGDNIGETDKMMDQFAATLKNVYTAIGENLAALPLVTTLINALAPAVGILLAQQFMRMSDAATIAGKSLSGLQMALAMGSSILYPWVAAGIVIALLPTAIKGYSMALHDLRMSMDGAYAAQQRLLDATEALTSAELRADDAAGAYLMAQENVQTAYLSLVSAGRAYADALARQQQLEEDLVEAQRIRTVAYSDFVAALAYARGETETYTAVQANMTWATKESELTYLSLMNTLGGLQGEYRALNDEMNGLMDANDENSLAMAKVNVEMDTLTLSHDKGRISDEKYEKKMKALRQTYAELSIAQQKNRIAQIELRASMDDTQDSIDKTDDQINVLTTSDDQLESTTNNLITTQKQLLDTIMEVADKFREVQGAVDNYKETQIELAAAYHDQWFAALGASVALDQKTAAEKRAFEEEMREKAERERAQQPTWPQYTPPPYVAPPARAPSTGIPVTPGTYDVYQHGGIVTKPTFGLLGEAGPEAVIPLSRMKAATPNAGVVVNIKIDTLIGTDERHAESFGKLSASHFIRELERKGVKM